MVFYKRFIRNLDSGNFLESFLVSAIGSILIIRGYLFLTGFPKIGSGDFHIAHMLWGGLLMCIAIYLMFTYMGRAMIYFATILGGIGFGTFIDELGKFVTNDNDYFYKPTVALIYVVFIAIYLIAKFSQRFHKHSEEEYMLNALDYLKEAILLDLDKEEKRKALDLLKKCNPKNAIVAAIKDLLRSIDTIPTAKPNLLDKIYIFFRDKYISFIQKKWFTKLLIVFFIFQSLVALFYALEVVNIASGNFIYTEVLKFETPNYNTNDYGEIISTFIANLFIWIGVVRIKFSRLIAFVNFKRSVLVSIFLTQFFSFLDQQFWALLGLFFNITMLLALDFMIDREKTLSSTANQPWGTWTSMHPQDTVEHQSYIYYCSWRW